MKSLSLKERSWSLQRASRLGLWASQLCDPGLLSPASSGRRRGEAQSSARPTSAAPGPLSAPRSHAPRRALHAPAAESRHCLRRGLPFILLGSVPRQLLHFPSSYRQRGKHRRCQEPVPWPRSRHDKYTQRRRKCFYTGHFTKAMERPR